MMKITEDHAQRIEEQKTTFIKVLRKKGVIRYAAQAAGISRQHAYKWRDQDAEFRSAWDSAVEDLIDVMEASVYERGLAGDSILSMFWLKAQRANFRDRLAVDVRALDRDIEERLRDLRERGFDIRILGPGLVSIVEPQPKQIEDGSLAANQDGRKE